MTTQRIAALLLGVALGAQSHPTTRAQLDPGDVVRVLVVDAAGVPQSGAEVLYFPASELSAPRAPEIDVANLEASLRRAGKLATSEADGIAWLPHARIPFGIDVCARKGELWAQDTKWDGQKEMRLVLQRDRSITVEVRDAHGKPAADVAIWLLRTSDEAMREQLEYLPVGVTDARGVRVVPHVQHWQKDKKLWAAARVPGIAPNAARLEARHENGEPVAIQLPPLGSVRVKLVDAAGKPLHVAAQVHLTIAEREGDPHTRWFFGPETRTSDAKDAAVTFPFVGLEQRVSVSAWLQRAFEPLPDQPVAYVRAGQVLEYVLRPVAEGTLLRGRALDARREPLARRALCIELRFGEQVWTPPCETDAAGRFEVGLSKHARPETLRSVVVRTRVGGSSSRVLAARECALELDADAHELGDFVLAEAPLIVAGRLSWAAGPRMMPNLRIELVRGTTKETLPLPCPIIDPDGRFAFHGEIPRGELRLVADCFVAASTGIKELARIAFQPGATDLAIEVPAFALK